MLQVESPVNEGSPSQITLTPTTELLREVFIIVTLQPGSAVEGMN